jgi:murein DD-endopeptidase MepM/ murein hydrolase activator NlpD
MPKTGPLAAISRAAHSIRRKRSRTATVGLLAAGGAAIALTMSACSPPQLIWNPLLGKGTLSQTFHPGHPGIDLYAPYGTPIVAATDGVVSQAGWWYGYGNYTCIVRDSNFKSCYGHQSYIFVHPGYKVHAGQTIGLVGSTGESTGPHLHFEIYKYGHAVDPLPLIPAH